MNISKWCVASLLIIVSQIGNAAEKAQQIIKKSPNLTVIFDSKNHRFTQQEISTIESIIKESTNEVRALLPQLTQAITAKIHTFDYPLDVVGGVHGRADTTNLVIFNLSTKSKGGLIGSAKAALKGSVYHELHHVAVGWTMIDNKYGNPAGIPIATVNEGLAGVFTETYTDQYFKALDYPDNAHEWIPEIMALPKDANYNDWISGAHPDGRMVIGYRLGRYIVHQALKKSDKDILELSKLHPNEILAYVVDK